MKIDTRDDPTQDLTASQKDLQVDSILSEALLEARNAASVRSKGFPSCDRHWAAAEAMITAEMQATYERRAMRAVAA